MDFESSSEAQLELVRVENDRVLTNGEFKERDKFFGKAHKMQGQSSRMGNGSTSPTRPAFGVALTISVIVAGRMPLSPIYSVNPQ